MLNSEFILVRVKNNIHAQEEEPIQVMFDPPMAMHYAIDWHSPANNQKFLEKTSYSASNTWRTVLANEHGRDGGHTANTKTGDDTTAINLANRVMSTDLHSSTNHENGRKHHQSVTTADTLVEESRKDGAEKAAGCQQRDDVGRYFSVCAGRKTAGVCGEAKVMFEALEGEDTAHDTSIIALIL